MKRKASKNMAVVEENSGNFKQALAYRKESEQWKDSLNNQNKVWALADYEKKYAVAQKQKQISVLKVENELKNTQRNTMFFSTIGLLLLLTGGVYVYGQKVKNAKIILSQKEKLDELNATKDQLVFYCKSRFAFVSQCTQNQQHQTHQFPRIQKLRRTRQTPASKQCDCQWRL